MVIQKYYAIDCKRCAIKRAIIPKNKEMCIYIYKIELQIHKQDKLAKCYYRLQDFG